MIDTTTYTVLGTTDEVTTCSFCGREDLKRTVALDADGETVYAGSDCAAKMAGKPVQAIDREARTADRAGREAAAAQREAERREERARFSAWLIANYGENVSNLERARRYRAEVSA